MQAASNAYKEMMRRKWRNTLTYLRVTIGVVNQEAQASMYVPDTENYTYYSDLKKPMDNYQVAELYATCDQDYTVVDGSMYFLPRPENADQVVLNQGIVSDDLLGGIRFEFPVAYDVRGLTIEFGKSYPTDFIIVSDNKTLTVTGNADGHYVTDEIFDGATYLVITPSVMACGQCRLRINQITMGIGIYFANRDILSATKKEHISPISEELPTIDFSLAVTNKDRAFDVENKASTINYLEVGQDVEVLYGQGLDDGSIEWMPGVFLTLKEWSSDDTEMDFQASDRFDTMNGTYYNGLYRPAGISLYDLAVDVFEDAGIDSRTYRIDPYLKDVIVVNPMPAVTHKEALQLIANAGRCIIYQDRAQKIYLQSSFLPDMAASSDNDVYWADTAAILDGTGKDIYASTGQDHTTADGTVYFLPRQGTSYLNVGYVSDAVADTAGLFAVNPTVTIALEASYKCFGLSLEFGRCWPETVIFHAYYNGVLQEDYTVTDLEQVHTVMHEFPEFDQLVLEFTHGCPNNRVDLHNITFGDSTDYVLEYGVELTKTPKGTQLAKVKELQVMQTFYNPSPDAEQELIREIISVTASDNQHTFYFTNASYDLGASITNAATGQSIAIVSSSSYYVTVALTGVTGSAEVVITGKEYVITQARVSRQLNTTGSIEVWENPLVSDATHAADLAGWVGDYLAADREYDLSYHGEPRLDANDIAFLENKYVPDLLIRVYDHTLKFNGGLSGTIKARRDMSNVAAAQNRLAGK